MPAELMYGQKPLMPIEETVLSWSCLPWDSDLETADLLALKIRQLERRKEDIDIATIKLKEARLKNKAAFDKKHRLRPREVKEGDWVLVYDSSLDNQYTTMRKMVKRWFGPYIVIHVFDNATYKLAELDGTELRVLIAGKRIKLFKQRDSNMEMNDECPEDEEEVVDEDEVAGETAHAG